ncbi:MAG: hypothetical protein LUC31_00100 [Coprobacillus sp.]|nr:hypothetical protein [Coprobacillus sp.]
MKTKKKSKYTNYLYYLLISLLLALCAYLSCNNLIVLIGVFVVFLFYFLLRTQKSYTNITKRYQKIHFVYNFVNNVVTSISVYKNVDVSVDKTLENIDLTPYREIGDMSSMSGSDKLRYLTSYFSLPIYDTFMNIIDLYIENGGDILEMTEHLLAQLKDIEGESISVKTFDRSKSISIGILWIVALVIPVFIRFALSDFFASLCSSAIYVVGIAVIYLFLLLTIEMITSRISHQRIKGVDL